MPDFKANKYYTYKEIEELLVQWQQEYPHEFSYEIIGKSYEKRDIWAANLTAKTEQKASEKPAYYIDANHHAGEVTGSSVALYTIDYLLKKYRAGDQRVKRLLTDYTFYIIPRIAVDGSEKYLTTPFMLRSSVREYSPHLTTGTVMKDVDGDGRILQMRLRSNTGKFKKSESDPRLMIRRQPDEVIGEFYDVLIEGEIEDYDGVELKDHRTLWGLDFNRNYPMNWQPENRQKGAGPYPLSESETRAVAEFIISHKNIAGIMSYHTTGGIILRPYCTAADDQIPATDLKSFKLLGEIGEKQTGYPCWSIYEKFTVDKGRPSVGSFMDFIYDYLGIVSFATELWDLRGRAGLDKLDLQKRLEQTIVEEEQDGLALLKYSDEEFAGSLFVDWYEFEHPHLGLVEIGGWQTKFGRQIRLQACLKRNVAKTCCSPCPMPKQCPGSNGWILQLTGLGRTCTRLELNMSMPDI